MWNPDFSPLLLSPVWFLRILAFSPASVTPSWGTFTSRFPHPLASLSHLPSLLSFRSPEPGTRNLCFRPRVRPEEDLLHISVSGPCPWRSVSYGSVLGYLKCIWGTWRRWRRRQQRLGGVGWGSRGPLRWPEVSSGQLAEARGRNGYTPSAGSSSGLTLRLGVYLPMQWPGDPWCCCCR